MPRLEDMTEKEIKRYRRWIGSDPEPFWKIWLMVAGPVTIPLLILLGILTACGQVDW